jgi:hypothetical protein
VSTTCTGSRGTLGEPCNCELPGCAPIAKKFTKTNSAPSAVRRHLLSSRDGYPLRNGAPAVDLHQSRQSPPRSRPSDVGSRSEPSDLLPSRSGGGSCRRARRRLEPQGRRTAVHVARNCLPKTRRSQRRDGQRARLLASSRVLAEDNHDSSTRKIDCPYCQSSNVEILAATKLITVCRRRPCQADTLPCTVSSYRLERRGQNPEEECWGQSR